MNSEIKICLITIVIFSSFSFLKPFLPAHFPQPIHDFSTDPLEQDKIELGRALFFDPILSRDSSISCSSCHSPYNSFAHTDHDLSHGIDDNIGNRNAPALFNLAWQTQFMWDGSINHLDMQALVPIQDSLEMDSDLNKILKKLEANSIYPKLFNKAFQSDSITIPRMLKALSQFQLSLVSANAKYDRVILGSDEFTAQEEKGYTLFKSHCNSCHVEPLFSSFELARNGLSHDKELKDYGMFNHTNAEEDSLLFKIPSLRNLSYSYPYMHDGRFEHLHEVLNHYFENSASVLNLEGKISSNQKSDLIAFILTLNDKEFIFNKKHSYPMHLLNQTSN